VLVRDEVEGRNGVPDSVHSGGAAGSRLRTLARRWTRLEMLVTMVDCGERWYVDLR
jgi:hypothetical protein